MLGATLLMACGGAQRPQETQPVKKRPITNEVKKQPITNIVDEAAMSELNALLNEFKRLDSIPKVRFRVTTEPRNQDVWINGQHRGESPLEFPWKAGAMLNIFVQGTDCLKPSARSVKVDAEGKNHAHIKQQPRLAKLKLELVGSDGKKIDGDVWAGANKLGRVGQLIVLPICSHDVHIRYKNGRTAWDGRLYEGTTTDRRLTVTANNENHRGPTHGATSQMTGKNTTQTCKDGPRPALHSSNRKRNGLTPKIRRITPKIMRRTIKRQANPRMRRCWSHLMRPNTRLDGKIKVFFEISPSGEVFCADIVQDTTGDRRLTECIRHIFKSLRFPSRPPDSLWTRVNYPISIKIQ